MVPGVLFTEVPSTLEDKPIQAEESRQTKGNSAVDFRRGKFRSTPSSPSRLAFEQEAQRKKETKKRWAFKNEVCAICYLHMEPSYLAGRRNYLRMYQYRAMTKKSR